MKCEKCIGLKMEMNRVEQKDGKTIFIFKCRKCGLEKSLTEEEIMEGKAND